LWLVDPNRITSTKEGYIYDGYDVNVPTREFVENIWNVVKTNTSIKYEPIIVYTKKDKAHLTQSQLLNDAFNWISPSKKWIIQNYTDKDQERADTDLTALKILQHVVLIVKSTL